MDWSISQEKRNKLQHALNGNPDSDTQIPNTILQLQEMVNAMTLDGMRKPPSFFPDVLQYTASSAINDFIKKNGIKTSKKSGYIRLVAGDLNDERREKLSKVVGLDYIVTINATAARQQY